MIVPNSFGSMLNEYNRCHNPPGPGALSEYNTCHLPGGRSDGGQFCAGPGAKSAVTRMRQEAGLVAKRPKITFEATSCYKCSGRGHIPEYSGIANGVCFNCGGAKQRLTRLGKIAAKKVAEYFDTLTQPVDDLKVGEQIVVRGKVRKVAEITAEGDSVRVKVDKPLGYLDLAGVARVPDDTVFLKKGGTVRRRATDEEWAAAVKLAQSLPGAIIDGKPSQPEVSEKERAKRERAKQRRQEATAKRRAAAAEQRQASAASLATVLEDQQMVAKLKALPHPRGFSGKTALDYVKWAVDSAGPAGKATVWRWLSRLKDTA